MFAGILALQQKRAREKRNQVRARVAGSTSKQGKYQLP